MTEVQTLSLSPHMVPAAVPLLRMRDPDLSLERWGVEACDLLVGDDMGAPALLSLGGPLLGVAVWRAEPARTLRVGPFIAFELSRRPRGKEALRAALERLARQRGCDTLLFRPPRPIDRDQSARWRAR